MRASALVSIVLVASIAPAAADSRATARARAAWVGVFRPVPADVVRSDTRAVIGHAGEIVVLTPGDDRGAPPREIAVVQPLVGMNLEATIDRGRIALPLFALDRREGADAVLVLPATTRVVFVEPTKADILAIRAALMKNEVLSGVKRALDGLEVGAIDVDGDRVADFAVTYGCNAWADGQCQSHGEFLLASLGPKWIELE